MTIHEWNLRYKTGERWAEDLGTEPTPLVKVWADQLWADRVRAPHRHATALDLACGAGRNAVYLAGQGWRVTAVDGAEAAIAHVREQAEARHLNIEAIVADLTTTEFVIEPEAWDLIAVCYYLQRDLFPSIRRGVRSGGVVIAIVHIVEEGEQPTKTRAERGELLSYFEGWEVLHHYEGPSKDPAHRRAVAEIVARRTA